MTVPSGLRLFRPTELSEIRSLLKVFSAIADEEGWQPGNYLETVPTGSIHIALECDGEIVGGLQAVLPDAANKLPCHNVWPEVLLPKHSIHVTIIAIKPEFRGRIELFWAICQDLWTYCADTNTKTILLECTPPMFAIYKRLGLPLQTVSEPRVHWGEMCFLTSVETVVVAGSVVMKARKSEVFRRLVLDALQAVPSSDILEAKSLSACA